MQRNSNGIPRGNLRHLFHVCHPAINVTLVGYQGPAGSWVLSTLVCGLRGLLRVQHGLSSGLRVSWTRRFPPG